MSTTTARLAQSMPAEASWSAMAVPWRVAPGPRTVVSEACRAASRAASSTWLRADDTLPEGDHEEHDDDQGHGEQDDLDRHGAPLLAARSSRSGGGRNVSTGRGRLVDGQVRGWGHGAGPVPVTVIRAGARPEGGDPGPG